MGRLVLFGNTCAVVLLSPEKRKLAKFLQTRRGYIFLLDPLEEASPVDHEVTACMDVVPRQGGEARGTGALGRPAPGVGGAVAGRHSGFVPLPSRVQAAKLEVAAAAAPGPVLTTAPVRQGVETAPGGTGSRHALLVRPARLHRLAVHRRLFRWMGRWVLTPMRCSTT